MPTLFHCGISGRQKKAIGTVRSWFFMLLSDSERFSSARGLINRRHNYRHAFFAAEISTNNERCWVFNYGMQVTSDFSFF